MFSKSSAECKLILQFPLLKRERKIILPKLGLGENSAPKSKGVCVWFSKEAGEASCDLCKPRVCLRVCLCQCVYVYVCVWGGVHMHSAGEGLVPVTSN